MTKFERAVHAAAELPDDLREQLGENLLHFVDKYLALRDDIDIGLHELDAGKGMPAEVVFGRLKTRFGA